MPTLTGSQKAPLYSLSGLARSGATRAGYFPPLAAFAIGGDTVPAAQVMHGSVRIVDELDAVPNTASLRVRGSAAYQPAQGQEIVIGLGNISNKLFAGHILAVTEERPRRDMKRPVYDLSCVDYTWQFDWQRVGALRWESTSVTTIISQMVAATCPGFSVTRVEASLASVTFQSNHHERPSEFMNRLMKMIGGYWYVDYDRNVHAFVTPETDNLPTELSNSNPHFWRFRYHLDVSQVRTRVKVTGGSSTTTATVAVGATTMPVDDTRLFASSGGRALVGANEITYTGKSVSQGPGNLTGVPASGAGSVAFAIAQGETVRVYAVEADATAAAALKTLIDPDDLLTDFDGYIEHHLTDGTLGDAAAHAAALGDLALNKSADPRVTYVTRDLFTTSGKPVAVDLTNQVTSAAIIGDFLIQRVVISGLEESAKRFPRREVEAGTNSQNLARLLGGVIES